MPMTGVMPMHMPMFINVWNASAVATPKQMSIPNGLPEWGDAALLDYLASIIASSMMGIMITWVERGKKESEEELKGMILQSFKAMKFIGLT